MVQSTSTLRIAVTIVAQSDCNLDQPLKEMPLRVGRIVPNVLPGFVTLEIISTIEELNADQIVVGIVHGVHYTVLDRICHSSA